MKFFYRFRDTATAWQIKDFVNELETLPGKDRKTEIYVSKVYGGIVCATEKLMLDQYFEKWKPFIEKI